jgi:hypothetical protein
MRALMVVLIGVIATAVSAGNDPIPRGTRATLRIPCDSIRSTSVITTGPNGLQIDGADLPPVSAGPPCLSNVFVQKSKVLKDGSVEVEVRGVSYYKLTFKTPDPALAFGMLFVSEAEAEAVLAQWRAHVMEGLLRENFGNGPLAELPDESKRRLIRHAYIDGEIRMKFLTARFKEQLHMVAQMGVDDSIYNDEKLKQAERLALLLNKKLLGLLRDFEREARHVDAIQGIKIELGIPHESFVSKDDATSIDRLELYAPMQLIRQFADADITAKKLLEGSVILINGNRVEVPAEL